MVLHEVTASRASHRQKQHIFKNFYNALLKSAEVTLVVTLVVTLGGHVKDKYQFLWVMVMHGVMGLGLESLEGYYSFHVISI